MMSRAIMKKPKKLTKYGTPLSDEWNTQQDLADIVGEVDWDPFSNPQSVIKAKVRGGLDNGIDGFDLKNWTLYRTIFVNGPFSRMNEVVDCIHEWYLSHQGILRSAIVVHKADFSTAWCHRLHSFAKQVYIPPKRMNFDSDRGDSSNFCSVVTVVGTIPFAVSQAFKAADWRLLNIYDRG
jgi:hypothetical protein